MKQGLASGLDLPGSGSLSGLMPQKARNQAITRPTVPALEQQCQMTCPTPPVSAHAFADWAHPDTQITSISNRSMFVMEQQDLKLS